MPNKSQLSTEIIPYNDQLYVNRLRKFLNDTAALNTLDGVQEAADIDLYHYIQDALDEINYEYPPTTVNYANIAAVPSWNVLKMGATLQYLTSKGILSSRNTLTYRDGGGVTVQDMDRYGRYINYYNILINKYLRGVTNMKLGANIEAAYGGVPSEYGTGTPEDY